MARALYSLYKAEYHTLIDHLQVSNDMGADSNSFLQATE